MLFDFVSGLDSSQFLVGLWELWECVVGFGCDYYCQFGPRYQVCDLKTLLGDFDRQYHSRWEEKRYWGTGSRLQFHRSDPWQLTTWAYQRILRLGPRKFLHQNQGYIDQVYCVFCYNSNQVLARVLVGHPICQTILTTIRLLHSQYY